MKKQTDTKTTGKPAVVFTEQRLLKLIHGSGGNPPVNPYDTKKPPFSGE
jgi:hypothetical protein